MKTFFKNLFGTKANQAKRPQHRPQQNSFQPQIEALEDRMLMAANVFHAPVVAAVAQQTQRITGPVISNIHPVVTGGTMGLISGGSATDALGSEHDRECRIMGQYANMYVDVAAFHAGSGHYDLAASSAAQAAEMVNEMTGKGCFVLWT